MMVKRYGTYLAAAVATAVLFVGQAVLAQIQLPAGTEVQIVFDQAVSSKTAKVGDVVKYHLKNAISVGGVQLVKAGAKGEAKVKAVEKAGKPGKPGKLELDLGGLEPDNAYKSTTGEKIYLQGKDGNVVLKGKGKKILSYLLIFGLFIKGGQGAVAAGAEMPANVKANIDLMAD
jgi:hypothetical protein